MLVHIITYVLSGLFIELINKYNTKVMDDSLKLKYANLFKQFFTDRQVQKLLTRLERISFKIAPINTSTGNTQTVFRWELDPVNPQYATQQECEKIFTTLANDLLGCFGAHGYQSREPLQITVEGIVETLQHSSRIGSLELPITYESIEATPLHTVTNIVWTPPLADRHTLEEWLNNRTIITKIQVKAYLTDRRQTGGYQTNREVRWETHPHSPQFSTRKDCTEIVEKLIAQVATFTGAPEPPSDIIPVIERALGIPFAKNSFRCPISGKPINYDDFVTRVASPVHGRSGYQVGHMNPLASTGGHVASNISWITDLGNRVQGEESLDNITDEIFYMATFHKNRLGKDWSEVEKYFS